MRPDGVATSETREDLGQFVARKRAEKELSLRELSALAGVSNAMLSQIETGWVSRPSFTTIVKLADALDVPVDEFARIDRRANPRPRRRLYA